MNVSEMKFELRRQPVEAQMEVHLHISNNNEHTE